MIWGNETDGAQGGELGESRRREDIPIHKRRHCIPARLEILLVVRGREVLPWRRVHGERYAARGRRKRKQSVNDDSRQAVDPMVIHTGNWDVGFAEVHGQLDVVRCGVALAYGDAWACGRKGRGSKRAETAVEDCVCLVGYFAREEAVGQPDGVESGGGWEDVGVYLEAEFRWEEQEGRGGWVRCGWRRDRR